MFSLTLIASLLLTQPSEGTIPAPAATDIPTTAGATTAPESKPAPSTGDLLRRIETLEKAEAARTNQSAKQSTAGIFTQTRFNPDISIIADFAAVGTNVDDKTAQALAVPGFIDQSDRTGKLRGINLNYLEFAFNIAVDPYFDFFSVVTIAPGTADVVDVEETYVDTRQLPWGFRLRIGKFLSAFGRLNGMHQHVWDFYDQPLVYEAFMGTEGFKNPGLRLSWTAPVDFLLQFNFEVFQGVSDESRTFNAVGYSLTGPNGIGTVHSSTAPFVPALYVGSLKTSFDFGDNVFLAGASVMYGHSTQTSTDTAFSAPGTILYNGELTYKYLISSYRSLTWQNEYLGLVSSGDLALASDPQIRHESKKQGGFYTQVIWRFDDPGRWRVGERFDLLAQNSLTIDGVPQNSLTINGVGQPLDKMLQRYTTMLEFSPTEFSRFRLQYAYDRSRYLNGAQKDLHEVLLQMNIAVGPHGAHSF